MHTATHPAHLLATTTLEAAARHDRAAEHRLARGWRRAAHEQRIRRFFEGLAALRDVHGTVRPTPLATA